MTKWFTTKHVIGLVIGVVVYELYSKQTGKS